MHHLEMAPNNPNDYLCQNNKKNKVSKRRMKKSSYQKLVGSTRTNIVKQILTNVLNLLPHNILIEIINSLKDFITLN